MRLPSLWMVGMAALLVECGLVHAHKDSLKEAKGLEQTLLP